MLRGSIGRREAWSSARFIGDPREWRARGRTCLCYRVEEKLGKLKCRTEWRGRMDYLLPRNVRPPHSHLEGFYWLSTQKNRGEGGKEMQHCSAESSVNGGRVIGQVGSLLQGRGWYQKN